jgi:septal ring factor EnvC (AmiA/AmiB activator)
MARAEELVAVADERAAALQRRLADAEAEMARMEGQVTASRDAVVSREGEVKRLTSLLEGGQDVDYLVGRCRLTLPKPR